MVCYKFCTMKDFRIYYNEHFRSHLQQFFASIPESSRHHDKYDPDTYYIQYERLSRDFKHLDFLFDKEDKINFGVALFLTVLADEVCYTHFKPFYSEFKSVTNYPKFIGNCPGGCHYHFHPSDIFGALNYSRNKNNGISSMAYLNFRDVFIQAIPAMEEEIMSFFSEHMCNIDGSIFWQKCYNELPFKS